MKITVHRGTNEIGGTCIEVRTEITRLLLDLGNPLPRGAGGDAPEGLPDSLGGFDAVLISHSHQDHYGLVGHISPDIPVYISELGKKFIDASRLFTGREPLKNKLEIFSPRKSFTVGDIHITPYPVDHSAADACSFLIESGGRRLFYSGDFRAHGRKSKLFDHLLKNPPENIDILFMEGTMLGRGNSEFPDEKSVEEAMLAHLKKEKGASFLIGSSQNIDRMVTAYRASKRSGRVFVVDIYTAWILKVISSFSKSIPVIEWGDVRVLANGRTAARHYQAVKNNPEYFEGFVRTLYRNGNIISHEDIRDEPKRYFIKNPLIKALMDECGLQSAGVVYSQWKGYMSEEYNPDGFRRFKELDENPMVNFVYAHTSGHAVLEDLQRFATAISPGMLVPIHTDHKERYSEYFENVKHLDDGKDFLIT